MKVDNNKLIDDYNMKNQQLDKKQQLAAMIKKEQLEAERIKAERIRTEHIARNRNDPTKGSNIDVSV
jgi:hypothetical protein